MQGKKFLITLKDKKKVKDKIPTPELETAPEPVLEPAPETEPEPSPEPEPKPAHNLEVFDTPKPKRKLPSLKMLKKFLMKLK